MYKRSVVKNDLTYGVQDIISVANMYFSPEEKSLGDNYLRTYNIMNLGDIAFEGHPSKAFKNGRFVVNTIGDGIVSHIFIVLKPISNKYDLLFWKYYINDERIMGGILARCTKSSTMMRDIVVDDFLGESLLVPSYEEQKLIGNFFRALDQRIDLERQRLEKLKLLKAACLEKMFV